MNRIKMAILTLAVFGFMGWSAYTGAQKTQNLRFPGSTPIVENCAKYKIERNVDLSESILEMGRYPVSSTAIATCYDSRGKTTAVHYLVNNEIVYTDIDSWR